jgi:hypothetical protein
MSEPGSPQLHHRGLWSSVVLQAIEDIENQPMRSTAFDEAVAFFTRSGSWAESRTMIGDFLELHRDDLETIGQRCIDARVTREELPPGARHRSADAPCVTPLKLARLIARRQGARSRTSYPPASQPSRATDKVFANFHPRSDDDLRL